MAAVKLMTKLKLAFKLFLIGLDQFIKFWLRFVSTASFTLFNGRSSANQTAYMPAVEAFCLAERKSQRYNAKYVSVTSKRNLIWPAIFRLTY